MKLVQFALFLSLTLLFCGECIQGYKILYLFPFAGKSHKNIFDALITELARRNHEVTVVSQLPYSKPIKNVKEIIIEQGIDFQSIDVQKHMFDFINYHPLLMMFSFPAFSVPICRLYLQNAQVKKLIEQGKQFDIVVVSDFVNECALATAPLLGKYIITQSPGLLVQWNSIFVPQPPSYVPSALLPYTSEMNLLQRLHNAIASVGAKLIYDYYILPQFQAEVTKLMPQAPSIYEAQKKISLRLISADPVLNSPRPTMPNIISLGGSHCRKANPLPKEFEDFVESSGNDGFIYFSLGSNTQSKFLPDNIKTSLLTAFSKLKQKVIWKYEEPLENAPSNVKVIKWAPQQDILGHPKIRVFITHGGLLSLQETLYNGVPVVAVPLFGDQGSNVARVVELKIGCKVDFLNISGDSVFEAVNEVLKPSYKENMKKYSAIFRDNYQHPLERGAFWVEYVIENDGAMHLRSPGEELNFFQYFLLDVIAFISVIFLAVIFSLRCVGKLLCKKFCSKTQTIQKAKKLQ